MAKKNVVIFDGEDKFINPKKAVYSKTRGQAKQVDSFKSVRAALADEEGPVEGGSSATPTYVQPPPPPPPPPQQDSTPSIAPPPQSNDSSTGSTSPCPQGYVINILGNCVPAGGEQQSCPEGTVWDGTNCTPAAPIPTPNIPLPDLKDIKFPTPDEIFGKNYVAPVPDLPSVRALDIRNTGMPNIGTSTITQETVYSPLYDDRKSTMPVYEAPVESVFSPITREVPSYSAPVPQLPTPVVDDRKSINPVYEAPVQSVYNPIFQETAPISSPVSRTPVRPPLFNEGGGDSVGKAPIFDDRLPNDGLPVDRNIIVGPSPYVPNPIYTAPVPILPNPTTPPSTIITPDPLLGGGSPVLASPEIPRPQCPKGFVFNDTTGMCIDKQNPDTEIDPIVTRTTTSSTTTTTTKAKAAAETTTTSSTTTTTTKAVNKVCSPPIYTAPKYYKWVDKGNCAYELVVDDSQLKDAAPAPVLPATGVPLINILPTGGLGTIPTTSTTVQTTTKSLLPTGGDSGGAGGGGGGSPFPEEPAPVEEAPKKNYFWWYVGGALAIYLILKRKKKQ